ncbi:MAG: type 1 glutamine amidotransferase [Desulfuromonadales bacterium]|nr:type 1 glutamine amidotransferase [Desulfuromonadales bacterium]
MIHIIQNDPEVPVGIVGEELRRCGVEQTVVRVYDGEQLPELSVTSGVIVLGGAMGANDDVRHPFLADLKRFIGALVEQEKPLMGICLGGQLLSAATGGEVTSNFNGEKGTYSIMLTDEGGEDRLFRGVGLAFISFQWHNDSFSIPPRGVRLAFTETCHNQAFRVGSRAWGVQFHPEVNRDIVREWSSWTPETAARTDEYVATFQEWEDDYRSVSRQLVANFVEIAGFVS